MCGVPNFSVPSCLGEENRGKLGKTGGYLKKQGKRGESGKKDYKNFRWTGGGEEKWFLGTAPLAAQKIDQSPMSGLVQDRMF